MLVDADRVLDVTTRATAAVLLHGERSVVSGPTAASLYGCTAMEVPATHVLVPYGHCLRSRPGLSVHNGPLPRDDVIELSGLSVLTVERLLGDLLCTVRPRDALATADQLLAAQPVDRREQLRARVAQRLADRRDQRGTRRGMRLLGLATGRAESPPESWLLLEVVDLGFPSPEVNWSVSAPDGTQLYRLDLAWPDLRIALEYDGYAVHAGRQTEDAHRAADLRRRGWIVLTATIDDLRDSRCLEGLLAAAFEQRGYRRSR
ncbi:MAG TPA: hypothetical protein VH008_06785 [Pseudonocardia sp.]|nr:hypothetical protein [Pseudonocardia sp.]